MRSRRSCVRLKIWPSLLRTNRRWLAYSIRAEVMEIAHLRCYPVDPLENKRVQRAKIRGSLGRRLRRLFASRLRLTFVGQKVQYRLFPGGIPDLMKHSRGGAEVLVAGSHVELTQAQQGEGLATLVATFFEKA